jgi:hypothetical protein
MSAGFIAGSLLRIIQVAVSTRRGEMLGRMLRPNTTENAQYESEALYDSWLRAMRRSAFRHAQPRDSIIPHHADNSLINDPSYQSDPQSQTPQWHPTKA